jgi:tetratricopeptide (TPR) repeat protein
VNRPAQFVFDAPKSYGDLREERDRVCASPAFKRSPLMGRLLGYLVDHSADNAGAGPKSYAIAIDVLGRGADFDPATDSYPRVMVGRLRAMLDEYYRQNPGPIRIIIPTGGYAVSLTSNAADASNPSAVAGRGGKILAASRRWLLEHWKIYLSVVLGALIIVATAIVWPQSQKQPVRTTETPAVFTLIVDPGQAAGGPVANDILGTAYAMLTALLVPFDNLTLQSELRELTPTQAQAAYRLTIDTVAISPTTTRVLLSLHHLETAEPIWSRRGVWTGDDARNDLFLASAASELASDYGVLMRHQLLESRGRFGIGLECLSQSAAFRRSREPQLIAPLEQCLRASITAFPERPALYRDALSFVLYAKFELNPAAQTARQEARQLAEEAFDLAGLDSATANFAMARSYFFDNDCASGARQLRAAEAKNPVDGDRLAFGATYMFMCGHPDARAMLERSVALDGDRASLALVVLAYYQIGQRDGAKALALLDRVVPSLRQEPQVDLARAAALFDLGRIDEARATMSKLRARIGADASMPAEKLLGHFISNPRTIAILARELRKRGLQA